MNRSYVCALVALAACGEGGVFVPQPPIVDGTEAALELVVDGLTSPVFLTAPAGDDRLFIVEQPGRIRILRDGLLVEEPFLDITDRVLDGGERGLLGLAFHPDYASNGRFYVNYTDPNGDTRVERYEVSADPDLADAASAQLVLGFDQPFANHNGGLLLFAPDGTLWIGTGDGGSGGDPQGNGQDLSTLLGKVLRIDVDEDAPYAVPPDNPFVGVAGARAEIWAYGLRNPWRFSIDATARRVYIADVGQGSYEEVNRAALDDAGVNYGWNVMEGMHCFGDDDCDTDGLTLPVLEYDHDDGACSVTGGYVYRGDDVPGIAGHYFYGDFCGGWVRSFSTGSDEVRDEQEWDFGAIGNVLSFGTDGHGELYVLTRSGGDGRVYRFVEP